MIRSLMYLTASRPDIIFAVCACSRRLISWQCKKQTIVATSTTEAEYVTDANCCGQVLLIQNQMRDYGYTVGSGEDKMEHEIELTDHVPQTPYDSPLSGGHTSRSDEGSITLKELTDLCTTLLQKVLDLENVKTAQGRKNLKSQQMFQNIYDVLDEDVDTEMIVKDKATLFDDEDVTIADTLVKMKNQKDKEKGIAFIDADDSARPIRSITIL
nr:putative ribonuclease H-like domain-containing protein [Tanacetum cinerariifolium]